MYHLPTTFEKKDLVKAVENHLNKDLPEGWCDYSRKISVPNKEKICNWLLEVHPQIGKNLINEVRVYVGWPAFKFENYAKLTRCFRCQKFEHVVKNCKSDKSCVVCTSN